MPIAVSSPLVPGIHSSGQLERLLLCVKDFFFNWEGAASGSISPLSLGMCKWSLLVASCSGGIWLAWGYSKVGGRSYNRLCAIVKTSRTDVNVGILHSASSLGGACGSWGLRSHVR